MNDNNFPILFEGEHFRILPSIALGEVGHRSHVMIAGRDSDMITAAIGLKSLRPSQFDQLEDNIESVIYVPWSAYVSQVLDQLQEEDCSVAVVVNEFGDLAGAATKDQILRFIMTTREEDEATWSIQELSSGVFQALGLVSVRSLAKRLEIALDEDGILSLIGLIQRQNGRFPRVKDRAVLGDYELVVQQETEDGWLIEIRRSETEQGE